MFFANFIPIFYAEFVNNLFRILVILLSNFKEPSFSFQINFSCIFIVKADYPGRCPIHTQIRLLLPKQLYYFSLFYFYYMKFEGLELRFIFGICFTKWHSQIKYILARNEYFLAKDVLDHYLHFFFRLFTFFSQFFWGHVIV